MRKIALIDFEASCLPDYGNSYPIEVALAPVDGESRYWLIRPTPLWETWEWSDEAESMHCISHLLLAEEGKPPAQVVTELAAAAEGYEVYADSDLDAYWLEILAHGAKAKLPFTIRHVGQLMGELGVTRAQVDAALDHAQELLPREHVARDDALRLAAAIRLLIEQQGGQAD